MISNKYNAIDLFSGCGGLSLGMRQAGFNVRYAIESDEDAVLTYRMNHPDTKVISKDIREVSPAEVLEHLGEEPLHLLAGCPPCQGFSSLRRLNKRSSVRDSRNMLILEYFKFVQELRPLTIMMENVPGLALYYLFRKVTTELKRLGYNITFDVVDVSDYGVPQRRKRLVLVGSLLGNIAIAEAVSERRTVRDAIGQMEPINETTDPIHKIVAVHGEKVKSMIALIPKNGGSRRDLPEKYHLACHKKCNVGFNDIYGRLRWDDCAGTITGGCLNPSKGRFLHPEEDRTITPREASLLQSFPPGYIFPTIIKKASLANLIGEALPPRFSFIQCGNIQAHLDSHLGG